MAETAVQGTSFPRRPGLGTTGRTIQVRTNFFPVLSLPGQDIIQYEVHVVPESNPRTNRRLYALWEDLNSNGILKNTKPVYDGRKYIYAPRALPLKDNQAHFTLELPDEEEDLSRPRQYRRGPRKFRVSIRKINEINMRRLHQFLEGKSHDAPLPPHDAVQALDILLRHRPSMLYTTVGRCFYTPEGAALIANGAELWQGFHQSIRPSPQKMLLNLDVSATAFYEPGPVVDIVAKILGKKHADEIRQPLTERDRQKVEKVLKNIKVITTHRGNSRRRWKISRLTTYSASRTMFPMKEEGGREESVANYFLQRYGAPLHYEHFPCLVVGDPAKHIYLPMEVCLIVPGQRILRKLNEKQTADMIRFTCQPPHVRSNKISNGFNLLLTQDNEYLQDFNVRLGREMATVNARVLTTPTISYHPSSRESIISPREGAWNLRDKKVAQGATLFSWSVVVFGHERDIPVQAVQKFLRELITTCRDTGVDIRNLAPPIRHANPQGNIETILKSSYMDAGSASSHKPQMVFCVLPNTGVPLYAEIKRVADTVIGIASQCVQAKHVFAAKKQYCANVCLKINVKLGGMNAFLANQQLPFVAERPTIIFGADITHPAPGDLTKPSIAALVGTMDAQCSRYAASIRVQKGRQEIIRDLSGMVVELLRTFYQYCGSKPLRIVFYRDGVSEGQFLDVAKEEVASIRKACNTLEEDFNPTITYLIVQKRHHARFFPLRREDADKSGNVLPGTVVESGITHPSEFDFYLASHPGLQGTSKPTHYHVLHDENQFTADTLQELTYRLCYLYCRATRAVSVCPPAYYAHLVAARARFHFSGEQWSQEESERRMGSVAPGGGGSVAPPIPIHPIPVLNIKSEGQPTAVELMTANSNYGLVKPELQRVMYFM